MQMKEEMKSQIFSRGDNFVVGVGSGTEKFEVKDIERRI